MAKPQENVPAVKEANLPAVIDFGADAGSGFEDADSSSYAIPFLRQLQALSPQCKKSDPAYIKGAEEGDFFNTVTEKLYKGEEGILVIPCHYAHKYNEWAPNRGGFRGSHNGAAYAKLIKIQKMDDKGRVYEVNDDTGNSLTDTREHYVVILNPDGTTEPALLALSGSQLKRSKKWMTLMDGICQRKLPMYSQKYRITAINESNDQGSWAGINPVHAGQVDNIDHYTAAKLFHSMVASGEAKAAPMDDEIQF